MKEIYRLADLRNWKQIAALKKKPIRLGLFGDPVAHSLSPQVQNAALAHCGIAARYARFHILPNELGEALALVRELGFIGVNLTRPHKIAVLPLLDEIDGEARAIGAVNTIVSRDGALIGFNTDGPGFGQAVRAMCGCDLKDLRVLILGAGGAARAIAYQCVRDESPGLYLCNRTKEKAERLRNDLLPAAKATEILIADQSPEALRRILPFVQLIVNATSLGTKESDSPPVPANLFRRNQTVFDTIYQPVETELLQAAARAGASTINGRAMLLHQGAAAFTLWFDRPAPLEEMTRPLKLPKPGCSRSR